jgi:hypothetical protein
MTTYQNKCLNTVYFFSINGICNKLDEQKTHKPQTIGQQIVVLPGQQNSVAIKLKERKVGSSALKEDVDIVEFCVNA